MNFFKRLKDHFLIVCRHKYWVGRYCFAAGLYWRGVKHDMSKFSPTEFWEGVKYYQGTSSPIDACKKENGWSRAWLHHRGRNDHHYEYWTDDYDHGGKALVMPKKPAFELICDYLGAGRAYMGKKFSYRAEYEWWRNKCSSNLLMDQSIKDFIGYVLFVLFIVENAVQRGRKISEEDKDFKSILEFGYEHYVETSKLRGYND